MSQKGGTSIGTARAQHQAMTKDSAATDLFMHQTTIGKFEDFNTPPKDEQTNMPGIQICFSTTLSSTEYHAADRCARDNILSQSLRRNEQMNFERIAWGYFIEPRGLTVLPTGQNDK
jgi:hypothetical protein